MNQNSTKCWPKFFRKMAGKPRRPFPCQGGGCCCCGGGRLHVFFFHFKIPGENLFCYSNSHTHTQNVKTKKKSPRVKSLASTDLVICCFAVEPQEMEGCLLGTPSYSARVVVVFNFLKSDRGNETVNSCKKKIDRKR